MFAVLHGQMQGRVVVLRPQPHTRFISGVQAQLTFGMGDIFARKCMYGKLYQPPEYYTMFARKIFFLPNLGATALHVPPPTPMFHRAQFTPSM